MNRLIFPTHIARSFRDAMLSSNLETAGMVFALPAKLAGTNWRFLVTKAIVVPHEAYEHRSSNRIELKPAFLAGVFKEARNNGYSIFLSHTHPWNGKVAPSVIDFEGEERLLPSLFARVPNRPHGRLILGHRDYHAAVRVTLNSNDQPVRAWSVGPNVLEFARIVEDEVSGSFDRQIRMFGQHGQRLLTGLRVAVVGLGGTGSIVIEQLAHLGVRHFLLCDPDVIDASNLNRVVGATERDIGVLKTTVAEGMIRRIRPDANVEVNAGSVLKNNIARQMSDCDILFCCTDSHGSRAVLNQVSAQYLVPMFDVGVRIDTLEGSVKRITGRAQMISVDLACLACGSLLDPAAVRQDLMSDFERQQDPYIPGEIVHQPSVITINAIVSSLATTMFLASVLSLPLKARFQVYTGETGNVRVIESVPNDQCLVCSENGVAGLGDTEELWGRRD